MAAALELTLLIERADGLRNRFEPLARNRFATEVRQSVSPLFQLPQGTLHSIEAADIPDDEIAGQLEVGKLLRIILVFPGTIGALALDIGLLVFLILSGGRKDCAQLEEVAALLFDENCVWYWCFDLHEKKPL